TCYLAKRCVCLSSLLLSCCCSEEANYREAFRDPQAQIRLFSKRFALARTGWQAVAPAPLDESLHFGFILLLLRNRGCLQPLQGNE
ncbi:MAG: hypothetical protein ABWY05_14605, partial [Noviherbaspirillum sp.]